MARIGWKNRLVTLLIKILKSRNHRPRESSPRRILIVSTTALGDTLWATPSIANVRASFPDAHLAILTGPIGKQVLLHDPRVDAIHLLREPLLRHFPALLRLLRKERFDAALLLHASQRLILPLLTLAGIPVIIGSAEKNKGFDHLLTTALPRRYEHEIERRARIVRCLGAATPEETLSYHLLPEETLAAQQLLGPKARPRIALHLGAKELFRRFPLNSFVALGKLLSGYDLFLTGTLQEEALLKQVQERLPGARILLHPFRTFAALLNEMDLILSTDTGPLHLACALNKPLLALFASSDPLLFGPHKAPRAHVLARPITCSPCLKRSCREPFCFLQFSPREIASAIEKICHINR